MAPAPEHYLVPGKEGEHDYSPQYTNWHSTVCNSDPLGCTLRLGINKTLPTMLY